MEIIDAFERASGQRVKYIIGNRRPGDLAECYSDPTKAKEELGWTAKYDILKMCEDSWNWQKNNPDGFRNIK